jgi:hypothetical protein
MNVRLRTLGIAEHSFDIHHAGADYTWLLYDVGGAVRLSLLPFTSTRAHLLQRGQVGFLKMQM